MHITGVLSITADNDTDLAKRIIGFYVETQADVAVLMRDGSTAILPDCQVGILHQIPARRILATGTGTTGAIIGVY